MIGLLNSPREIPDRSITNLGGSISLKEVYFNEFPASSRICVLAGKSTISIFFSTGIPGVCTGTVNSAALTFLTSVENKIRNKAMNTARTAPLKVIIFIHRPPLWDGVPKQSF